MRPLLKIGRPKTPSHLTNNRKALLLKEREQEEIQRKNRILYEKMAYMKPSKLSHTNDACKDNYHPEKILKAPSHGTLNLKTRMKELSRIDKENEKIKDKLISQKTHYPVQKILKDAYKKEEIKRNILFNSSKVLWNH